MAQCATSTQVPAFVVVELDEFPESTDYPSHALGVVRWNDNGTALIWLRADVPVKRKIRTITNLLKHLEQKLTPDGTGYWSGIKLASSNVTPEVAHIARPELALVTA